MTSTQIRPKTSVTVTDFSRTPSGRYPKDGPDNGQDFRERFLAPALESAETVSILLDGAEGYPSSFLDEAFGGLVRNKGYSVSELHKRLTIECNEIELKRYVSLVWRYIDRAVAPPRTA